jgi:hypothetical protein
MSKKSSKPQKVKELQAEDEVSYFIQRSDDFTQIMLTVKASRPLEFFEYLYTLDVFLDDCIEENKDLFSGLQMDEDVSVH